MPIRIYNSLTQRKEPFEPLTPGRVGMYACGVTVYDACHIGHARSAFVFDVIRRYLEYRGYRVRFVRNFTDVDDKIIARAAESGRPWKAVADQYIAEFREEMRALGLRPADVEPRATDYIPQMIQVIEALIARGLAYPVDGDVYFEVRRFPSYGKLSHRNLDELQAGARVETDERKRDALDFALWKAAKPGEPAWESPWGAGRPGWHIECSAMSVHHLGGPPFDIHGGGLDLIFPHHENEIAQSEGASGAPLARVWMHHGLVNIQAAKMSKSLGNIIAIRRLLQVHRADAVKLFFLQTHYRSPVDYSPEALGRAQRSLERFHECFGAARRLGVSLEDESPAPAEALPDALAPAVGEFEEAMEDDFNAPRALGSLFGLVREINGWMQARRAPAGWSGDCLPLVNSGVRKVRELGRVLALDWRVPIGRPASVAITSGQETPVVEQLKGLWARYGRDAPGASIEGRTDAQMVELLLDARKAARRRRDFRTADAIRDALVGLGVDVRDLAEGTEWRWAGA